MHLRCSWLQDCPHGSSARPLRCCSNVGMHGCCRGHRDWASGHSVWRWYKPGCANNHKQTDWPAASVRAVMALVHILMPICMCSCRKCTCWSRAGRLMNGCRRKSTTRSANPAGKSASRLCVQPSNSHNGPAAETVARPYWCTRPSA